MINLILSDTKRSLNYIQMIEKINININKIIFFSNKKKSLIYNFVNEKKINNLLIYCKTNDINSPIINKKLELYKSKLNIISTYPGEIVKNTKLLKKSYYIHIQEIYQCLKEAQQSIIQYYQRRKFV